MSDFSAINASMGRYQPAPGNDTILAAMGNEQPVGVTVTLGALSASVMAITQGNPETAITLSGRTAGSGLSLVTPRGLSLSGTTISGTATSAGSIEIDETLAGATNSPRRSPLITVNPPVSVSVSIPTSLTQGTAITPFIATATGGTGAKTWSLSGFPAGISINASGQVSGTPTASGSFANARVIATDTRGATGEVSASLTVATSTASGLLYEETFTGKTGRLVDQPLWFNPSAATPAQADVSNTLTIVDGVVTKTVDTGDTSVGGDGLVPILLNVKGNQVVIEFLPGGSGQAEYAIGWKDGKYILLTHSGGNQLVLARKGFGNNGVIGDTFADGARPATQPWKLAIDRTAGTVRFVDTGDSALDTGVKQIWDGSNENLELDGHLFGIFPMHPSGVATGQMLLDRIRIYEGTLATPAPAPSPTPSPSPSPSPTPTPGPTPETPQAATAWNNYQGVEWYNGPVSVANLGLYHHPQYSSGTNEADPTGSNFGQESLIPSRFGPNGEIAEVPPTGFAIFPHPPQLAGQRFRVTWNNTAGQTCTVTVGNASNRTTGTNPDGSKWLEFDPHPAFFGSQFDNNPFLDFQGPGGVNQFDIALKPEINLTTGKRLNPNYWSPAFVEDVARDYTLGRSMALDDANRPEDRAFTADYRPKPGNVFRFKNWGVAFENIVDLHAQANIDLWFNVTFETDKTFVDAFMEYAHAYMPAGRQIGIEDGNEYWNPQFVGQIVLREWAYAQPKPGTNPQRNWGPQDGGDAQLWAQGQRSRQLSAWMQAKAAQLGTTVGPNGRFVRIMGGQNVNPANNMTALDAAGGSEHVDWLAVAPYFGEHSNVAADGSHISDIAVIHQNMMFGRGLNIDEAIGHLVRNVEGAAARNVRCVTYEANTHIDTLAGNGHPENAAGFAQLDAICYHPNMLTVFSYYLGEMTRRTQALQAKPVPFNLFAHVGKATAQGVYNIKRRIEDTVADSPRYKAMKDAVQGIYHYPPIQLFNTPAATEADTIAKFRADVRGGRGFGVARDFSMTGAPPAGLIWDAATGTVTIPSSTPVGTYNFTIRFSDASGAGERALSFVRVATQPFAFTEDARSQSATAVALADRGWTDAAGWSVQNGYIRAASGAVTRPKRAIGTGMNRRIRVELERGSLPVGQDVRLWLFDGGLNLFIRSDGAVQVHRGFNNRANLATAAASVPADRCTLDVEVIGGVVRMFINGEQVGATVDYLPTNESDGAADAPVAFEMGSTAARAFARLMQAKVV